MKKLLLVFLLILTSCSLLFACNKKKNDSLSSEVESSMAQETTSVRVSESINTPTSTPASSQVQTSETASEPIPDPESTQDSTSEQESLQVFTGIVFENVTIDYDGEEHTITALGIPQNATVSYTNAGPFKNAGEYTVSISVSAEGYTTYTKDAKLTINKIDFPATITFEDTWAIYNGEEKSILISGDVPIGTQIQYENNVGVEAGTYYASATLTNANYNTKTLNATLTIYDLVNIAKNTINNLMDRPDPWSFMPEAFTKESLTQSNNPTLDFTSFVNVNNINSQYMGAQMYVLWEGVEGMSSILSKIDAVYAVSETIASAYQTFINDNPEEYSVWSNTVAGFKIKIELLQNESKMLIGNNLMSVELYANSDENVNKGRIEIAGGAILNYEMKEDYLKFNVGLTIKGIMVMKQIEFVRTGNTVAGYLYEYKGAQSVAIKTSAVVAFNEDYSIVMSAKRESDDLLIDGYEEVYSSTTGKLISAEVKETNKLVNFDTFWVNVFDVDGITSIKAIGNGNLLPHQNQYDMYLNGSSEIFKPKKGLMGAGSRHFDVEMKTVYYVTEISDENGVSYEVIETQIPMLFVQKDNVEDFSDEATSTNKNTFTVEPSLPLENIEIANTSFDSLKALLDAIKETLTYEELALQLGERDAFFDSEA